MKLNKIHLRSETPITLHINGAEPTTHRTVFDAVKYAMAQMAHVKKGTWILFMCDGSIHGTKSQLYKIIQSASPIKDVRKTIMVEWPSHFDYFIFTFDRKEDAYYVLDTYTSEIGIGIISHN